jgi:hypothetical protein
LIWRLTSSLTSPFVSRSRLAFSRRRLSISSADVIASSCSSIWAERAMCSLRRVRADSSSDLPSAIAPNSDSVSLLRVYGRDSCAASLMTRSAMISRLSIRLGSTRSAGASSGSSRPKFARATSRSMSGQPVQS